MESKNTTNFEAKTDQKINYPPNFGGLPRGVGKIFWPETNFRVSPITKRKFWVHLEPHRSGGSVEKWIWMVGAAYMPPYPCVKEGKQ